MSCPFAAFRRQPSAPSAPTVETDALPSGPLSAPLSLHLRKGTAAAHTAIERSQGVKILLASATSTEHQALVKRLEYVRWLVMLHALYSSLEAVLFALASPDHQAKAQEVDPVGIALLNPLLHASKGQLLQTLARSTTLVSDLQVHAALTEHEEGASLADVADALELEVEVEDEDEDNAIGYKTTPLVHSQALTELLPRLWNLQAMYQPGIDPSLIATQRSWLNILTGAQKEATGGYVARIAALAQRAGIDLGLEATQVNAWVAFPPALNEAIGGCTGAGGLATHAYTRYLGDLSGGQFIAKHVRTKWPTTTTAITEHTSNIEGLQFYAFLNHPTSLGSHLAQDPVHLWRTDSAAKGRAERALKDAFRSASDTGLEYASIVSFVPRAQLIKSLVEEAALSFLLNGALFDSLAGSHPDSASAGSAAEAVARANARSKDTKKQPRGSSVAGGEGVATTVTTISSLPVGHPPIKSLAGLPYYWGGLVPSWALALLPLFVALLALSLRTEQEDTTPVVQQGTASTLMVNATLSPL